MTVKKKSKPKAKEQFPHYYICSTCAQSKGLKWPKGHCATMHQDICPYCKSLEGLCAVSDWLKPGEKNLKYWD